MSACGVFAFRVHRNLRLGGPGSHSSSTDIEVQFQLILEEISLLVALVPVDVTLNHSTSFNHSDNSSALRRCGNVLCTKDGVRNPGTDMPELIYSTSDNDVQVVAACRHWAMLAAFMFKASYHACHS